ncbi:MAG: cupin domain-containing protein [Clostridia bacterium]|nr:cupin domain-containing protein [Clostridia bacterium]
MTGSELAQRLGLAPHVEGGAFRKLYHEEYAGGERRASGVIYYALAAGERADFHRLDSDEYWLWHAGETLEIWCAEGNGQISVRKLGAQPDAEPCCLIPAGTLFGVRPCPGAKDTTVVSCVTVPDFSYFSYQLLNREEALALAPDLAPFFEN